VSTVIRLVALVLALAACKQASSVGKVAVGAGPVAALEAYCAIGDDPRCGQVYACATEWNNEIGLVEICVSDSTDIAEVEDRWGACELSPHERFDDLGHRCYWHCPAGKGCQGFNGCWCPPGAR
jgi:hypothetical protein